MLRGEISATKLQVKLKKLARDSITDNNASIIVGYTASYALPVHEDLKARHREGTQAKYLEQPFRELQNSGTLRNIITKITSATKSLKKGLLFAGNRVQRESQKIVPVDTGFLKASAFTREESNQLLPSTVAKEADILPN